MAGRRYFVFIEEVDGGCVASDVSGNAPGYSRFDTVTGNTMRAMLKRLEGALIHSLPPEDNALHVEPGDETTEPGDQNETQEIPAGD